MPKKGWTDAINLRAGDILVTCNGGSVKDSPSYRSDFIKVPNGTTKVNVNNRELLSELNKFGKGCKKVYSDGYLGEAKASLHFFQDAAGKVFNVKYKIGWSVL